MDAGIVEEIFSKTQLGIEFRTSKGLCFFVQRPSLKVLTEQWDGVADITWTFEGTLNDNSKSEITVEVPSAKLLEMHKE